MKAIEACCKALKLFMQRRFLIFAACSLFYELLDVA